MKRWALGSLVGGVIALVGGIMLLWGAEIPAAGAVWYTTATPTGTVESVAPDFAPTYYRDVALILAANCVQCHQPGGIAPFPLDDAASARAHAEQIALATHAGYMPPWMPGPDSPPIVGERRLTPEEVRILAAWAAAGAPLGDRSDLDSIALAGLVQDPPLRADMALVMPEPYTPDDTLSDDYRCFIIDPATDTDHYVTAYTILPGQPSLVHHVILYQVSDLARASAERLANQDPAPGWQCFGGSEISDSEGGGLQDALGTWTPGSQVTRFPAGTGRLLRGDGFLIMQVHYNLQAGAAPDETSVLLQLAEETVTPVRMEVLVAPVEIPCPADATSEDCDRDAVLARAIAEDGYRVKSRADSLLQHCDHAVSDYTTQDAAQVVSTCEVEAPATVRVIGTIGHMHTRGTAFRLDLDPDTAAARTLLSIPAWDFHWQETYFYREPVVVERGTHVRITCVWDNTHDPDPRYILWGEGTDDEMCLGAVYYVLGG